MISRDELECFAALVIRDAIRDNNPAYFQVAQKIGDFVWDRLVNAPEFRSFTDAVVLEAQHQLERWGTEHDAGKTDADWLWLLGYLASKALHNPVAAGEDPTEKKLHRIITIAAAAANWHAQILGKSHMRPGIVLPAASQERF